MKNNTFAIVFTIAAIFCGVASCQADSEAPTKSVVLSGSEYWFYKIMDSKFNGPKYLKNVKENAESVSGNVIGGLHGSVPFTVSKKSVLKPESKTGGYILYIEEFVSLMEYHNKQKSLQDRKNYKGLLEQISLLTGESFKNPDEIKSWLNKNKSQLIYSEDLDRMVIIEKVDSVK